MLTIETGSKKEIDCLEVRVGKKTHNIPLTNSMPLSVGRKLRKVRKMPEDDRNVEFIDILEDFIEECLGEDAEQLTVGDLNAIIEAWFDASKDDGVSAGE